MVLSDSEILKEIEKGNIKITPFNIENLGSNSYDVCLGNTLLVYENTVLDCKSKHTTKEIIIPESGLELEAYKCYLGVTVEHTTINNLRPCINGKSSLGRLFLSIHETAGYGDVNFSGFWTLEIVPKINIIVYPYMKIAQLEFQEVKGHVINPYNLKKGAKYSNNYAKPIESKNFENFE